MNQTDNKMINPKVPKGKRVVRLVIIISDTHGHHEMLNLPEGDILIHCGDFSNKGSSEHAQRFADWFSGLSMYAEKLVISGNHDRDLKDPCASIDFTQLFPSNKDDNVHFLDDQLYVSPEHGVKIFGASWTSCEKKTVCRQLEKLKATCMDTSNYESNMHTATDILLTHAPKTYRSVYDNYCGQF